MPAHSCSFTIEAGTDGRFRGRFEVVDAAGREVATGVDPEGHATQQKAWASIPIIANDVVAGLG